MLLTEISQFHLTIFVGIAFTGLNSNVEILFGLAVEVPLPDSVEKSCSFLGYNHTLYLHSCSQARHCLDADASFWITFGAGTNAKPP